MKLLIALKSLLLASITMTIIINTPSARADNETQLVDAPSPHLLKNLILVKMPSFELSLQPKFLLGNKGINVQNVAFNPSLPNSANDLALSEAAFNDAIGAVANAPDYQAWNALIASTQKNCPTLTLNGMVSLLSIYGNNLSDNYNESEPWIPTPLNEVAESLVQNSGNAGVCRDIHTALAEIAEACGLKDVGAMFVNWQRLINGKMADIAHSPGYYLDPKTGQFIIMNYGTKFNTGEKYLAQAADVACKNLSPTCMVADPGTNLSTSPSMHQMLSTQGSAMLGTLDRASDLSSARPVFEISVGNLNLSGSAQTHYTIGGGFVIGAFGAAVDDQQTHTLFGTAGGAIAKDTHLDLSDKVEFNSSSQFTVGVFDIHDQDFQKNLRNAFEGTTFLKSQHSISWHTEHAPGSLSANFQAADNFSYDMIGVPYNFLSIKLNIEPTQHAEVHAQTTEIVTTKSIQDTTITLQRADDSVGAKIHKNGGKYLVFYSDSAIRFLGGVGHGVTGEEEDGKITMQTRAGSFSTALDLLTVQNQSNDYFYNLPLYCKAQLEYDKIFKGIEIKADADYTCNHERKLSLPGEQPFAPGDQWNINQPRGEIRAKISWGKGSVNK